MSEMLESTYSIKENINSLQYLAKMIETSCDCFKGMVITNIMKNQMIAEPFQVCKDDFGAGLKCMEDFLEKMLV